MSDANGIVSRRQFCAGACQLASCATVATLVSACGGSPTGPSDSVSTLGKLAGQFSASRVQVNVSGSALANVGGAALVESVAGVFLLARTGDSSFTAVEAVCTHEGCTVTGASGDEYVCPCHGSRYTRTGQVVQGPARSALRQYGTSFASDVVTIAL
jgi:cytochrome b6-f complex iron-sulfur subunit